MSQRATDMRETWGRSFRDQIAAAAYNTAPVEAVVRTVAYYLRAHHAHADDRNLHFLDLGCGAGPNMVWLAEKGIKVSGIDIAPTALALARANLARQGLDERVGELIEGSATEIPFEDECFDGVVEACVIQHLDRINRARAFAEVRRVLKPGGVFVGHMLSDAHTVFRLKAGESAADDPRTLILREEGASNFHLTNIGLSHFFGREEFDRLLAGFATIDPCETGYDIPREEAARRGYERYHQGMWTVYAVK